MKNPFHTSRGEVGSDSRHPQWSKNHAVPVQDLAQENHGDQPTMFDRFLEAVSQQLQPEGRAQHTAGMHRYLLTLLPPGVTLADLVVGWRVLAESRQDTNSAILSRRKTCAELATIAAPLTSRQGDLAGARKTWQAWFDACQSSTDPRLGAMRQTFAREIEELQSAP